MDRGFTYSFTRLQVLTHPSADEDVPDESDRFIVAVTFGIGRLGIPVVAEFTSPESRTVVMRIVDGEGLAAWWKPTRLPSAVASTDCPARLSWKPL